MSVYPYSHRSMWTHLEGVTWKREYLKKIYPGNSLNVYLSLATAYVTDGSYW